MDVGHTLPTRPDYYDRSPAVQAAMYDVDGIAPHANTIRWSVTIPTGKIGMIDNVYVEVATVVVPTGVGQCFGQVLYWNGASSFSMLAKCRVDSVVADSKENAPVGQCGAMVAGDQLEARTQNADVNGSVAFTVSAKILTFDK